MFLVSMALMEGITVSKSCSAALANDYKPYARFTFKFDLDQVFDQSKLLSHTGKSALAAICNPIWGGSALDRDGRNVDLGMLAGGL